LGFLDRHKVLRLCSLFPRITSAINEKECENKRHFKWLRQKKPNPQIEGSVLWLAKEKSLTSRFGFAKLGDFIEQRPFVMSYDINNIAPVLCPRRNGKPLPDCRVGLELFQ
jgi:hypothetical protein